MKDFTNYRMAPATLEIVRNTKSSNIIIKLAIDLNFINVILLFKVKN